MQTSKTKAGGFFLSLVIGNNRLLHLKPKEMLGVIADNCAYYTDMKESKATDGDVIKISHHREERT